MSLSELAVEDEDRPRMAKVGYPQLCYRCNQTIAWARSSRGKRMLMDFYPDAHGHYIIIRPGRESVVARIATGQTVPVDTEKFSCHFDTCSSRVKRPKGRTAPGKGLMGPEHSLTMDLV